ncbi:hypothetical protein KUG88_28115 [Rhodococcus rhodochrous]|uniref:hypothetical protein n=1 Tax=Rhodococcus rhodochrous TaxID=1829 RepID=UPI001E396043|nr:hypothetical protein [Rhodococcus rhodochrous]MCB8913970.1 hypothetical protein [Rhodococcus rhodochrous]
MTGRHGTTANADLRWTVEAVRRRTDNNKRRFRLRLNDANGWLYQRLWTATKLRGFADTAVDALDGIYHTRSGRWSSNMFDTNRIAITEHRETRDEHMLFGRDDLERIVARIDELLED